MAAGEAGGGVVGAVETGGGVAGTGAAAGRGVDRGAGVSDLVSGKVAVPTTGAGR